MIKQLQSNKFLSIFPLALFLLNLLCKSFYLSSPEISHDEPFSIYHAQFDLTTIIHQLKGYNNPPLYEILLHFWIKLFGISAVSVRSLPLFFASLSPVVVFYLGKKHFSERAGVVSALLLSFSNLVTYHSHDCRVYTLFLLLSILSMYYFLEIIAAQLPRLRAKILFVVFSALLIYSHYFGFFILFIQGIYILFLHRRMILTSLVYYGIIALLYLPHLLVLLTRFKLSVGGTWLEAPSGAESLYNMIWSFSNAPMVAVAAITLLTIALTLAVIKKNWDKTVLLIALWFLVPFLGMFFLSFAVPMYISRYLIYAAPAFYLLLTLSIEQLSKSSRIANILSAMLVLGFIVTTDLDPVKNTHVTGLIKEVKSNKKPGAAMIVCPFDLIDAFSYNYNLNYFSQVSDQQEYHLTDSLLRTENIFMGCASQPALGYSELIYVIAGERNKDPSMDTAGIAAAGFKLQNVKQVDDLTKVFYFQK